MRIWLHSLCKKVFALWNLLSVTLSKCWSPKIFSMNVTTISSRHDFPKMAKLERALCLGLRITDINWSGISLFTGNALKLKLFESYKMLFFFVGQFTKVCANLNSVHFYSFKCFLNGKKTHTQQTDMKSCKFEIENTFICLG